MSKNNKKIQNIVLALGIVFFLIGIILFFLPPVNERETYHLLLNATLLLVCALFLYFSLLAKAYGVFYVSLNLCIFSLMMFILRLRAVSSPLKQYWPITVIICGITLLPAGRLYFKEFRASYIFSSVSLTFMGAFFLLFTFKIIKEPIRIFFGKFLPAILAFGGIALIVLYYVRQNASEKFPYINDGNEDEVEV